MKFSTRGKNYILLLSILICFATLFYGIYALLITNIIAESESYRSISQQLADMGENEISITAQEKDLKDLAGDIALLDTMTVPKDNVDFIKDIERLAETNLVAMDTPSIVGIGTSSGKMAEKSFSIQLQVTGGFLNVMRFIDDFKRLPFYTNVEKIEFTRLPPQQFKTTTGVSLPGGSVKGIIQIKIYTSN